VIRSGGVTAEMKFKIVWPLQRAESTTDTSHDK